MLNGAPVIDAGRLFAGLCLDERPSVVAAVSGGGDSLALLFLLKSFLDGRARRPDLLAVTVDHRLRPESAEEAQGVARLCAAHGIRHRTVVWEGEKPATGVAAAARAARHRLLAEAAVAASTDLVLTGHTEDDQAETVTMRAARGPGLGGAGIAPATLHDGRVWFARPLLSTRRAALRACLSAAGIAWIDDPTNVDIRYERARTRRALDAAAIAAAAEEARRAAVARGELGRRAGALISKHATRPAPGLVRISRELFGERDRDAALHALRLLLATVGGREHLPDERRAAALFDRLATGRRGGTLSRAVADQRADAVYLYREARNLPTLPLGPKPALWDGRYRLSAAAVRLAAAPLGPGKAAEAAPGAAPPQLLRRALAAEPALWRDGECLGPAADRPEATCRPVIGPYARYLPSFDLAAADAVARMVGADPPPDPPFCGKGLQ